MRNHDKHTDIHTETQTDIERNRRTDRKKEIQTKKKQTDVEKKRKTRIDAYVPRDELLGRGLCTRLYRRRHHHPLTVSRSLQSMSLDASYFQKSRA